MKHYYRILMAAAISILAFAACDQQNKKELYTPEQENEVSFAAGVYSDIELPASTNTVSITIARNSANGEITVPLQTTLPSEIKCPESVTFAADAYETTVDLDITNMVNADATFKGTISIADETYYNANTSPYPSISVTLKRQYNWESLGEGEFWDNMMTHPVIVKTEVLQATNAATKRFRIMNPFPNDVIEPFAVAQGGKVGGAKSEYIEFFHVDATSDLVSWTSPYYPGVSITVDGSEYGDVEGGYTKDYAKQCSLVMEKVYQFYPYYSFSVGGSTYSWGKAYSAYLSLPGGPSLKELLGL